MKNISGSKRIAIMVSVVWFLFFFIVALFNWGYDQGNLLLLIAIFPLLISWGIWWISKGFKKQKKLPK